MKRVRSSRLLVVVSRPFPCLGLAPSSFGGCMARPVNPALAHYEGAPTLQFEGLGMKRGEREDVIILAFSGGGMRAAAFSYGVLEVLRRIEISTRAGRKVRLLDEVDLITG